MNKSEDENKFGFDLPRVIDETLDMQQWGFELVFSKLLETKGSLLRRVIYSSEWCQIKYDYYHRPLTENHELHISYGRLHAPNDNHIMIWKGEECYCWHSNTFDYLYFLDRLSPREAFEQRKSSKYPVPIEKFFKPERRKQKLQESGHLTPIRVQGIIWEHYGVKLLELFDLRHPDIWEKYSIFLKEFKELENEDIKSKGGGALIRNPPQYKVC